MSWWVIVLWVISAGAVAAAVWQFAVARWPEPELAGEEKVRYASLGRGLRWLGVGLVASVVAAVVCLTFPVHAVPAGLVLATLGVVLAGCDTWTTWMPARLCHVGWVAIAVAVAVSVFLPGGGGGVAVMAFGCGAVAFGGFALLWWRGVCGFSDARFVILLAVTGGLVGVTAAAAGIAAGCVVAAAHSVVLRRRGHRFFPWAPGLLLGALIGTAGFALLS